MVDDSNGGEHEDAAEFDSYVDSIDRQLAVLRIENETMTDGIGDDPTDAYIYRPSNVVTRMHRAPRGVGHTNRLASFLVETSRGDNDYLGGLKLFVGFFIITPFVIWLVLLLALKLKYEYHKKPGVKDDGKEWTVAQIPTPKTLISDDPNTETSTTKAAKDQTKTVIIPTTSWIAGGAVIDMYELSNAGVSRKERKKMVLRSWKIQSTFLSASILIPVLSVVLLECGWKPLALAVQEIQELNGEVETLAYRGWNAVDGLESSKEKLFTENELVRSILEYSYASTNEPDRKPFENDESNRSHNNNGRHRRAQFFGPGQATSVPTLQDTSDFDSPFFIPWSQMPTSSPSEHDDISKAKTPLRTEATSFPMETSIEKINNTNNGSSSSIFKNKEEGHIVEEKNQNSTSLDGFFNTSSSDTTPTPSIPTRGIFIEDWCPDAVRFIGTEELNHWTDSINSLTSKTQTIHQIFNSLEGSFPSMESWSNALPTTDASSAFRFVTDATNYVHETTEWFFANDWLLKLLVLVLNVINGLLLANVYFVSKNNIIHQPTRMYVAYVLVPVFVIAAVSIVVVTVASGLAILINSDFCSGGSGIGGPQGTIEDAIRTLQQQQQNNGEIPNEALNLAYDAVDYYWTGCLTENPLAFLEEFSDEIDDAAARINQFTMLLPIAELEPVTNIVASQPEQTAQTGSTTTYLSVLNKACQRDMSFLTPAVDDLKSEVDQIRTYIHKLSDTMSCGQVSPLLRKISHGAVCIESPQALGVLWGTSFGIGLLCFVLLTVRAALYNSVKYKKRRPKKPRRIVEKEFDEYKEFMGKYYGEKATNEWNIDGIPLPPTKLEIEFDKDIDFKGTFDTANSTKGSGDDSHEDGGSEKGGIFIHNTEHDDSSYGSSYDSECSDDDKSIDSENGDEQSSAIGSFLSETKSIAMQTLHSLRNVKSLLSGSTRNNILPSHVGNSNLHLGRHNSDESYEEEIAGYENEIFFSRKFDAVSDLGGNDDRDEDGESVANSISDASLYLPTPTSQSGKNAAPAPASMFGNNNNILTLSKDDDFCDEDGVNDEEDEILASHSLAMAKQQSWTPTAAISALSPLAPRKPLSFLARTLYPGKEHNENSYTDEELNSLVQPTQLANLNSFRSKRLQDTNTARRGKSTRGTRSKQSSRR